jgi:hypothetical protein
MMIFEEGDHMMKDGGLGFRTADIQDGVVHEIEEHNFPWLKLATRNQNDCPNSGCKNWNLIQISGWRNLCSFAQMKDCRIVPRMDNYEDYDKDQSNMNMVHVGTNCEGSWLERVSYH